MVSLRLSPMRDLRVHLMVKKNTDSDYKVCIDTLFINSVILSEPRADGEEGDGGVTPGEHEEQR